MGETESDGSMSRPHGLDHGNVMYYYMVKVMTEADNDTSADTNVPRPPTCWSREVTSGAQTINK